MFDKKVFGARLHALREARDMTASQLAKTLGVTNTQIGDMERGNSATSMTRLYELCVLFEVSADYLLGLTDDLRPLHTTDTEI